MSSGFLCYKRRWRSEQLRYSVFTPPRRLELAGVFQRHFPLPLMSTGYQYYMRR